MSTRVMHDMHDKPGKIPDLDAFAFGRPLMALVGHVVYPCFLVLWKSSRGRFFMHHLSCSAKCLSSFFCSFSRAVAWSHCGTGALKMLLEVSS
ncbi:unnamed protein product, partial [Amoebophrya sp. A120]|eukprot:GSA120T00008800001.1